VSSTVAGAQVASSRAKLTGRAAVLLLVIAVLAVSYASSVRAYLKQRSDINALNAEIADKRADVEALQEQKARLHDPAYIEQEARQRFGWILPGEVNYRVIGTDGEVLSDGGSELSDPAKPDAAPDPEWWQDVYGTVEAAGEQPEEAQPSDNKPSGSTKGTGTSSQKTDR
jgi:cell division protein FtsB